MCEVILEVQLCSPSGRALAGLTSEPLRQELAEELTEALPFGPRPPAPPRSLLPLQKVLNQEQL